MTPTQIKEILSTYYTNLSDTLPDPAVFADVFCYRNTGDPGTVFYISLRINPEKGMQEKLQFNLLLTGNTNILQLGCRWDIDRDLLKKLNQALLEKLKPEGITFINFSVPSATIKEVRLELADDENHYKTLQTANSSGFPPYSTIFNLGIDSTQKDRVLHTMNGSDDFMRIRFFVSIPVNTTASATLKGSTSEIPELEKPGLDETAISAILQKAIKEGIFVLSFTGSNEKAIQDKLTQNVLDKAIPALKEYGRHNVEFKNTGQGVVISKGYLSATATEETAGELSIEPEGRVSSWFAGTNTTDYVTLSPGVSTAGNESSRSNPSAGAYCILSAPRGIEDAPVNFVRFASGNESVTMSPPDFLPVKVSKPSDGNPIRVNTSYTDGGTEFETELPDVTGSEYTLGPPDIGMASVDFDASALATEEAKACRVVIDYKPAGNGTRDERTIYLKPGEWSSRWLVCTRDKSLQGELTYEVKVTNKDGSNTKYNGSSKEPIIHFKPK